MLETKNLPDKPHVANLKLVDETQPKLDSSGKGEDTYRIPYQEAHPSRMWKLAEVRKI